MDHRHLGLDENKLTDCELCGARPDAQRLTWPEAPPASASAAYHTCTRCGLVFCNPPPGQDEHAAFHEDLYSAGGRSPERLSEFKPERSRQRQYAPKYQAWAKRMIRRLELDVCGEATHRRFLEIGCASGGILKAARDLGLRPTGVEVSREAAEYGLEHEKLDIRIGQLQDLRLPDASFDIVLLHDVIEHVPAPLDLLRECVRLLMPGGVICLHTVNVDSATARFAGHRFYLADTTGGHAVLFSPRTLRRYCKLLGLEPLTMETRGFRIVQNEHDRKSMGWKRGIVRLAENIGHEWVKLTNRGHFVLLVARRRQESFHA